MLELTLESLARRLEDVERLRTRSKRAAKDRRMAAGMFTGREFSKAESAWGMYFPRATRPKGAPPTVIEVA